jgi:thymidylate synthase
MGYSFQALHYRDLLHPVNPAGDVGLITLWSPLRAAKQKLESISPEILDRSRSRVAVVANLYGDGLYAMFCNLLFNPQIRHLIAIGEDLGLPTCAELGAFLARGLEDDELLGAPVLRIAGTARVFAADPGFDEQRLRESLSFRYLGKLSSALLGVELMRNLSELPRFNSSETGPRVRVQSTGARADAEQSYRPSNPGTHQVIRRRPLECWEELVVRAVRYGRPVTLSSGPRLELLNAKAVITEPAEESAELLGRYGFSLDDFHRYQQIMFETEIAEDTSYSYGNRLGAHFHLGESGGETLAAVIERLRANPETRHAFISLWDTSEDLAPGDGHDRGGPCLVTLFFRRQAGALSLTATYRSHNLLIAWLQNVYGLMAIQRHVAAGASMPVGPITVISHSLGIDPRNTGFARARQIAGRWKSDDDRDPETGKYSLREDPNGYFVVSVDEASRCVVAEHRFEGVLIKRYSGTRAAKIAKEISADMSVSFVSHAMWLGGELARKEAVLHGE